MGRLDKKGKRKGVQNGEIISFKYGGNTVSFTKNEDGTYSINNKKTGYSYSKQTDADPNTIGLDEDRVVKSIIVHKVFCWLVREAWL